MQRKIVCTLVLILCGALLFSCTKPTEGVADPQESSASSAAPDRSESEPEPENRWLEPALLVEDLSAQFSFLSQDELVLYGIQGTEGYGTMAFGCFVDLDGDGEPELLTSISPAAHGNGEATRLLDVWQREEGSLSYRRIGELFVDLSALGEAPKAAVAVGEESRNGYRLLYITGQGTPDEKLLVEYAFSGGYRRTLSSRSRSGAVEEGRSEAADLEKKSQVLAAARIAEAERDAPYFTAARQALDEMALYLSRGDLPGFQAQHPMPEWEEMYTPVAGWADDLAGVRALMEYSMEEMSLSYNTVTVPVTLHVDMGNDLLPQGEQRVELCIYVQPEGEGVYSTYVTRFFVCTDGRFVHHKDMPLLSPEEHPLIDQEMYQAIGHVMLYTGQFDPNLVALEYGNLSEMDPEYLLPIVISKLDRRQLGRTHTPSYSYTRAEIVGAAERFFGVSGFEPPSGTVYGSGDEFALPGMGLPGNPPLGRYALSRLSASGDKVVYRMYIYENGIRLRVVNEVDFVFRVEPDDFGECAVLLEIHQVAQAASQPEAPPSIFD